ncbi:MAG: glutamate formimidoyltransferase [Bacteroidia bacterium]|nr:glutamate formimidoyltransferase [Bacteroidia bacterium]MDW8157540.1 glutamate formimidoyltransferase [Bacteroidia bacterium]
MHESSIIECVPNFSEGRDSSKINAIAEAIRGVEGVQLLDIDPGKATNRTVMTFVGSPEKVVEAAFAAIRCASQIIDMRFHQGEHPRIGATDVCPLIPISGISMQETVEYAKKLAQRVGEELGIPVYLYAYAAQKPNRENLATIRAGEYEGLAQKMRDPEWIPDFGPTEFNPRAGATVIGARDLLVAYNINLNTRSVRRANSVAFDLREQGRILRKGHPVLGEIVRDEKGEPVRLPGVLKAVKAIGWYIEEYGIAQVSMNLTNIRVTPIHVAFEEACKSASARGLRVTGSELVGMVPLEAILEAGRYFLKKQGLSAGASDEELIHIAVKSLGLDELAPFDPQKKIIEYAIAKPEEHKLVNMSLKQFADETARETPAPGGGSISAYVGALGAALGTMVANLSASKRGWEEKLDFFSKWAVQGQQIKKSLVALVDQDTMAFNQIMQAYALPKNTDVEKEVRQKKIQEATRIAIEIPYNTLKQAYNSLSLLKSMFYEGNPNSITDAAVGILCARTAMEGAYFNIRINGENYEDKNWLNEIIVEASGMIEEAQKLENEIKNFLAQRWG